MAAFAELFAVTLDCPEPVALARFYQAVAGGEVRRLNDEFAVLTGGGVRIDFQRAANHAAPWPDPGAPRRAHLDFGVEDLASAEQRVLAYGAVLAAHQPGGRRFRVFVDPAGHPFCLVDAADAARLADAVLTPDAPDAPDAPDTPDAP